MWELYLGVYVGITLSRLWYSYILLYISEHQRAPPSARSYNRERLSVIIPFYNEDPVLLDRTLHHLLLADGNKQVIVVDDGSTTTDCAEMVRRKYPGVVFVRYEQNRGKRHAQQEASKYLDGAFVITLDSDAVVEYDALTKLVTPLLNDERLGATTGNVKVLDYDENFLTRMIAARYWNAFSLERKALSSYGIVTCCSGVLSAYRRTLWDEKLPAYTSQTFLGVPCTYGDDRHLTNLLLRDGWRITLANDAVVHTAVPTTYRQFFRQQLRWKKSFLRESYISLTFAFRHSWLLPIEVLFSLLIPFMGLAVRVAAIIGVLLYPWLIIPFALSIATVALLRNYFLMWEQPRLSLYSIPYAFLHEFGLYWLYFIALFGLRETTWRTR